MLKTVILTLNEERHISACIESVYWTDEVIVFDSYSTDNTVTLAKQAGATILQHSFEHYSQQRNAALAAVEAEWIFFIDADERATPELAAEIKHVIASENKVGWWVPRYNYILGHRMRGAGWRPDYQLRLLRRDCAHYDPNRAVHEIAELDGEAGYLQESLIHYNYETLQQFISKQRKYTDYDAGILLEKNTPVRFYTPYREALRHFGWRFFTLGGWRDSIYGLLLCTLMSYYEMVKYRKVQRARNSKKSKVTS
ncbi:MAG: glycosyltransferase family 2 protein [Anaerolineae bacterium]|nr:glycosyltransferase family 2 protein [Anaerolineae bacterium]